MQVDLFDFELPDALIALRPKIPRESARLLHVDGASLQDFSIDDLPGLLCPGDVIVINDTRVIPARLHGRRGQAKVEATLHKRLSDDTWVAFGRPAKRFRPGDEVIFADGFSAEVMSRNGPEVTLKFDQSGLDLFQALNVHGELPLPPYIASRRAVDAQDADDYQTIFASKDGAVAAPTAGLHLTDDLLARLGDRGIAVEKVTLHVGAGTFLPVKVDDTDDHQMHEEIGILSADVADRLNAARGAGGRIITIGTTSLRLLESAVDEQGVFHPFNGGTDIFITPGVRVNSADILLTNFHLPRSTLFMLVSAFAGMDNMRAAYEHAIEQQYRFYSYGDACLLERQDND